VDGEGKANIAYGAHELAQSILDQLADIYKETKRHKSETTEDIVKAEEQLGEAILGASKYIHRLFNAIKHLYLIIGIVEAYEREQAKQLQPDELRDAIWAGAFAKFPEKDFDNLPNFVILMRFGFGLEGLKKLEFDLSDATSRQSFRDLLESRFSFQKGDDSSDEGVVYGKKRNFPASFLFPIDEVITDVKEQDYSKERLAASAIRTYLRKCLKKTGTGYWEIENRKKATIEDVRKALTMLVVHVLADYAELVSPENANLIGPAMKAAQRPYPGFEIPLLPVPPSQPKPETDSLSTRRGRKQ
jgi:hypothetical protein